MNVKIKKKPNLMNETIVNHGAADLLEELVQSLHLANTD